VEQENVDEVMRGV